MVKFLRGPEIFYFLQISQNINGFRQNNSQQIGVCDAEKKEIYRIRVRTL